jgi:hypothetical protein
MGPIKRMTTIIRCSLVTMLPLSMLSVGALTAPAMATSTNARSYNCSCVTYVRITLAAHGVNLPGGPATAGGYQERWMDNHGWHRVRPPGNGTIPSAGKVMVMVWDPNQKGAFASGHMAIVATAWAVRAGLTRSGRDPWYNYSTRKWNITVLQVDWGGNCNVSQTTFTGWGDLYGINFYVPN